MATESKSPVRAYLMEGPKLLIPAAVDGKRKEVEGTTLTTKGVQVPRDY